MNQSYQPRYSPQTATRQVRPRSREVVDYHYDEQKPGKPLWLLIPGALIALAALGLIIFLTYLTFGDQSIDQTLGTLLIVALAPFYIGGVFLFSYGYELYDVPKAIRLTVIIVFITFAAIFMFAVVLAILGALGKSKSSSSSRSSSSSGSSSRSYGRGGGLFDGIGPVYIGGPATRTVTREVVREVPVEPPAPQPIRCAYCGRPFIPQETQFACPHCGGPVAREFVDQ